MSGDIKIIHRYFPREVEEVMVWWLWLVRPMRERIEAEIFGQTRRTSFVWPPSSPAGHKFTPDRLREGLKRVSMMYMGTAINIQSSRHLMIAMSRRYLQGKVAFRFDGEDEQGEIDEDQDNIIDQ